MHTAVLLNRLSSTLHTDAVLARFPSSSPSCTAELSRTPSSLPTGAREAGGRPIVHDDQRTTGTSRHKKGESVGRSENGDAASDGERSRKAPANRISLCIDRVEVRTCLGFRV